MNFYSPTHLLGRWSRGLIAGLMLLASAFAANAIEYTHGGVVYEIDENYGEAKALRYDGSSETVKILDFLTYQDSQYPVKYEDLTIFENKSGIRVVDASAANMIPEEMRFADCQFLNALIPPKQWETVGEYQFYNCSRLDLSTVLTPSVHSVGRYAFAMSDKQYIGELHGVDLSSISNKTIMENRFYSVLDLKNRQDEVASIYDSKFDMFDLSMITCLMFDGYDIESELLIAAPQLLSLAVSNGSFSLNTYSAMPEQLKYVNLSGRLSKLQIVGPNDRQIEFYADDVEVVENLTLSELKCDKLDLNGKVKNLSLGDLSKLTALTGCEGVVTAGISTCFLLESINLPDIEEFVSGYGNTNLKEIYLGEKLSVMNQHWTFDRCKNIEDFIFGGTIEQWLAVKRLFAEVESPTEAPLSKVTNFWYGHGNAKITKLTELNSSNIGNASEIGPEAFAAYKGLTKIDLPSSVKVIGPSSFAACTNLKSVKINAEQIAQYAFYGVTGIEDFTIGNSLSYIGPAFSETDKPVTTVNYMGEASRWAAIERSLTVYLDPYDPEAGVGNVVRGTYLIPTNEMLFNGKPLETLVLDNPESIPMGVYANNKSLTTVKLICRNTFPDFGEKSFYGCNSLKRIELESTTDSRASNDGGFVIGKMAFAYCTSLEEIPMLDNLKAIASDALYETGWLKKQKPNSVVYLTTEKGLTAVTYNGKPSAESTLVIEGGAEAVNDKAFADADMAGFTSLSLPGTLNFIGADAFAGTRISGELKIPASVDSLKSNSFEYVTRLVFEDSDKALYYERGLLYSLNSIYYGRNFTEESGRIVAQPGTQLSKVEYGKCVTLVDYKLGVPMLCEVKNVYSYSEVPPVCYGIGADTDTCVLYVPKESVEAYRAAEGWGSFKNILPLDASEIENIGVDNQEASRHYDLNGRIVNQSEKGVHIVVDKNGKARKVIIR